MGEQRAVTVDPHELTTGGHAPLAGRLLYRLAAVQWASRDLLPEIRGVYLGPHEAWVEVGDRRGQQRFGPVSYDNPESVESQVAGPAGLALGPPNGSGAPVVPMPDAPWRHHWAELLRSLGTHGYVLREGGGTRRYESVTVNELNVASVVVVNAESSRWISRIALDPPSAEMIGVAFDIRLWIGSGKGSPVDDRTKIFDIRQSAKWPPVPPLT